MVSTHIMPMMDIDKTSLLKQCLKGEAAILAANFLTFDTYEKIIIMLENHYGSIQSSYDIITRKLYNFKWQDTQECYMEFRKYMEEAQMIAQAENGSNIFESRLFYSICKGGLTPHFEKLYLRSLGKSKLNDDSLTAEDFHNWVANESFIQSKCQRPLAKKAFLSSQRAEEAELMDDIAEVDDEIDESMEDLIFLANRITLKDGECYVCKGPTHNLNECDQFKAKSIRDRRRLVASICLLYTSDAADE